MGSLQGEAGLVLRMSDTERARWLEAIRGEDEHQGSQPEPVPPPSMSTIARLGPSRSGPVVLLTTARARPCAAALVAGMVPHVPVLSIVELERSSLEAPPDTGWLDLV